MHRQTSVVLLLAVVVLLIPALCAGGFLPHACPCGPSTCQHETGCLDDPCVGLLRPEQDSGPALPAPNLLGASVADAIELLAPLARQPGRKDLQPSRPRGLGSHRSDLPLLI